MLALLLAACLPSAAAAHSIPQAHSGPAVIAYVFPQNHLLQPGEIAAQKLTRINYAFANVLNGKVVLINPTDAANLATLVALKSRNPSLQVLVSVGGWRGSGNFSSAALTAPSRAQFVDSAVDLIERNHLDGLDIDWEYPGQTGAGNTFRPEDKTNYTRLLAQLRKRFDREQRNLGRPLLLTIAAGADDDFLEHTEMRKVARWVDTVNLMAYDYYTPGSDRITGNHAPLYTDPDDPKKLSADTSVRHFENAGVPPEKLVLGVPFYGHVWGNVPEANHGLFQPGSPVPNAFADYQNIVDSMLGQGFTRYWDNVASVPYLYNPVKKQFVSYEDPQSLALKCAYVKRMHLGGIMFWEYESDPSGALLDTIHQAFFSDDMKSPKVQP